jgi:formylglycine-generating enzyme required for sulfatase activity
MADEVVPVPEGWARVPAGDYPGARDTDHLHVEAPYLLAAREVTRAEWFALFATAPSKHPACGDACPVDGVTWYEAVAYANELSAREHRTACYTVEGASGTPGVDYRARAVAPVAGCTGYRLPTAVEWEVGARAGKGGTAWVSPSDTAWYGPTSGDTPHPVATRGANAWGLHDMLGNVREWTWDASGAKGRMAAGGSWADPLGEVGVGERDREPADRRSPTIGFRLVRAL